MKWDWTINAGNVLTAIGLLIGFIVAHQQNIKKIQEISTRVDIMFRWFQSRVIKALDE